MGALIKSTNANERASLFEVESPTEVERLEALASYRILDTETEKSYDNIASLAASLCETPIAAVSLIDHDRQWFKARQGLDVSETSRDVSFCARAVETVGEIMIVEDATKDPRFQNNPLVTGSTGIRFYAGAPIISRSGHALGALCVIDTKPRSLAAHQKKALRTLGDNVLNLLELRKTNLERIRLTSQLAKTQLEMQAFAYAASHDLRSPLRGIDNLAKWIKEDAKELDDESNERIVLIQGRISRLEGLLNSISSYYDGDRDADDKRVNLRMLVKSIKNGYKFPKGFTVNAEAILESIEVPVGSVERILNHLISNAIKHHDRGCGTISISAGIRQDNIEIAVSDDGPGIPEAYHEKVFQMFQTLRPRDQIEGAGMGLAIAKKLVRTAGGKIWIEPSQSRGTTVVFTWPILSSR